MALCSVLIAHSGKHLSIDTSQFSTVDDFKLAVSRQSAIDPRYIIALTPQGRPLKLQTLPTEVWLGSLVSSSYLVLTSYHSASEGDLRLRHPNIPTRVPRWRLIYQSRDRASEAILPIRPSKPDQRHQITAVMAGAVQDAPGLGREDSGRLRHHGTGG